MTTEIYSDGSENVSTLPIVSSAASGDMHVVYSVPVTALSGDLLKAMGQFEVTNPTSYTVGIGCKLLMASSATDVTGTEIIGRSTVTNVPTDMLHMVQNPHAMKKLSTNWSGYINLVLWAASNSAQVGDEIVVQPGYGQLDVSIIR